MTISYPLVLPSPAPSRISYSAISSVALARSPYTYDAYVQDYIGKALAAEVTLPPLTEEQARDYTAFFLALNGAQGTFLLKDCSYKGPRGTALGQPIVGQPDMKKGQQVIGTGHWVPEQLQLLMPGDMIQIGVRLYRIIEIAESDVNGYAELTIWPGLRESPLFGEAIYLLNLRGLFRLTSNTIPLFEADIDGFYSVSFACVEAL